MGIQRRQRAGGGRAEPGGQGDPLNEEQHRTLDDDQRRRGRAYEYEEQRRRELAKSQADWEAAAKHFHPVPTLYQIDWDAYSPEAKRAQLQADDATAVAAQEAEQQGRIDALMGQ